MTRQHLTLKRLSYEHMGPVSLWQKEFCQQLVILQDRHAAITGCVLRLVAGVLSACDHLCSKNSRVEAAVEIGDRTYQILILFPETPPTFHVSDEAGRDRTLWYLQTVAHPEEIQKLSYFESSPLYTHRLQQYRACPHDFRDTTADMSMTQTFRTHLRQFIRRFRAHPLQPEKDLWLCLERNGRFTLRRDFSGDELPCLSETEAHLFRYYCFLHLLDFWSGMEILRNHQEVHLPVLIQGFINRLDEAVAQNPLYDALPISRRQVIVLNE